MHGRDPIGIRQVNVATPIQQRLDGLETPVTAAPQQSRLRVLEVLGIEIARESASWWDAGQG